MLQDPDSSVRSEALWALGAAGGLAAAEVDKVVAALGDFYDSLNPAQQQKVREFMQHRGGWRRG